MRRLFESFFGIAITGTNRHHKIKCIWHPDSDPSLDLDLETGEYRCYGCHKTGNVKELLPSYKFIEEAEVERLHQALMEEPAMLQWLREVKGYTVDTVRSLKIGYNGNRYCYPVRDVDGRCINLRLYSSVATPKYISYGEGFGSPAFYPHPPREDKFYLFEGESDTTLARQLGIPGYCQTSGAHGWSDALTRHITGKSISIVYDTDAAGRTGASKVINHVKFVCKEVKNIRLPIPHGMKDFSEWIIKMGGSSDELRSIESGTPSYAVSKITVMQKDAIPLALAQAAKAEHAFKVISSPVMVAGKNSSPYVVPKKVQIECSPVKKQCSSCPNSSGSRECEMPWEDGTISELAGISKEAMEAKIKKKFSVPHSCSVVISSTEHQNIECVALYPKIEDDSDDIDKYSENVVLRKGYLLGQGIVSNTSYKIIGMPIPDSRDQSSSIIIIEAEPIEENQQDELKGELLIGWKVPEG